jgi:hypothetical protein
VVHLISSKTSRDSYLHLELSQREWCEYCPDENISFLFGFAAGALSSVSAENIGEGTKLGFGHPEKFLSLLKA